MSAVPIPQTTPSSVASTAYTRYVVDDLAALRRAALNYHKTGFGRCDVCDEVVSLTVAGMAFRHGQRRGGTPPCEGSGKVPLLPVRAA